VTVTVNLRVSATADPDSINAGEQSQLTATAEGGTIPYSYAWTPAASLDNPLAANPLASPTATTTYTVVVNDGAGAQRSAQAVVEVIPASGVTACFTAEQMTFGPFTWNVQADGSCSTGAIQFYRWWADFNFEGQLPTFVTSSPIPPVFAYEEVGTFDIRLEADDGLGNTHAVIVPFTVAAEP
jgi:hypothetical protein